MNWQGFDITVLEHRVALQSVIGLFGLSTIGWLICKCLADRPLARHLVATCCLLACIALPIVSFTLSKEQRALIPVTVRTEQESQPVAVTEVVPNQIILVDPIDSVPVEPLPTIDLAWIVIALYGAGVLFGLAKLAYGYRFVRSLLATAAPVSSDIVELIIAAGVEPKRPVPFSKIVESPLVSTPMVTCARKPVLVLPTDMPLDLAIEEFKQILAHESVHVTSGHLWLGWLNRAATILLWPLPAVHGLAREANVAQEDLCDVAAIEKGSAATYARALLLFAEQRNGFSTTASTCNMIDPRLSLETRIKGLLDPRRRVETTMKTTTKAAVYGATLATMLVLAGTQIVLASTQDAAPALRIDQQVSSDMPPGPAVISDQAAPYQTRLDRRAAKLRSKLARLDRRTKYVTVADGHVVAPAGTTIIADGRVTTTRAARKAARLAPRPDGRTIQEVPAGVIEPSVAGTVTIAPGQPAAGAILPRETVSPSSGVQIRSGAASAFPRQNVEGVIIETRAPSTFKTRADGRIVDTTAPARIRTRLNGQIAETRAPRQIGTRREGQIVDTTSPRLAAPSPDARFTSVAPAGAIAMPVQDGRAPAERRIADATVIVRDKYDKLAVPAQDYRVTRDAKPGAAVPHTYITKSDDNGGVTVIENATVVIRPDGTVEIRGGKRTNLKSYKAKPAVKAKAKSKGK